MRFSAFIPMLLSIGALILSLLALLAGHTPNFMEDYAIVTLNTTDIGKDYLNSNGNSGLASLLNGENIATVAKALGLHDFYSWHVLDFCEGYYDPTSVTSCSTANALYNIQPAELLQSQLDQAGHSNINIGDLGLPEDIDNDLAIVRSAAKAMYILYCVGIALAFVAVGLALISVCLNGRLSAFFNVLVDLLAFVVLGGASAIATAISVKGASEINSHTEAVGVTAIPGTKFLGLTWAAVGCMLIASMVWCFDCCAGRSRPAYNVRRNDPKYWEQ